MTNATNSSLPVMLDVLEVANLLGVGRSTAYELCRQPGFPVVRIGKQLRIPRDLLLHWIEQQAQADEREQEAVSTLN